MNDWILQCPSCPTVYALGAGLFDCPAAGSGAEHILRRMLAAGQPGPAEVRAAWTAGGGSFERLRPLVSAARLVGGPRYHLILGRISAELLRTEGQGFEVTPLVAAPGLSAAIGRTGRLWVKDETGNVSGSHKGRHLMGTLLYMEALRETRPGFDPKGLAIYSCGNAALAAAAVARAGGYELHAFVPADVDPLVARLLAGRGAIVEQIPRSATGEGDPCYLAFRTALARNGWLPFACAGNDNWSNIEGGATLGWELVMQLAERSERLDSLVIQVGGGALARSVAQAFEEALQLRIIEALPRIHVCQPEGGFPFVRAYLLVLAEISRRMGHHFDFSYDHDAEPMVQLQKTLSFARSPNSQINEIAQIIKSSFDSAVVQSVIRDMAGSPGHFMWPWDGPAPHSLAHGILDDVTYDWFYLLRAVLRSGGRAEILAEDVIRDAYLKAQHHTGIAVCPTGAAGLAGLIQSTDSGAIDRNESVGLFFTGFDRSKAEC